MNNIQNLKNSKIINSIKEKYFENELDIENNYRKTSGDLLNKITQEIENRNKNFSKNIVKNNYLDGSIFTKDKLIIQNDYEANNKSQVIGVLSIVLIYLVILIVPLFLIMNGTITSKYGYATVLLSAIIVGIIILVYLYKKNNRVIRKSEETAKDFSKDVLKHLLSKDYLSKCPKDKCRPPSNKKPPKVKYNVKGNNEVWLDNSQNIYSRGDIPTVGGDSNEYVDKEGKVTKYMPKPAFPGDPNSQVFNCVWAGNPKKNIDKNKLNIKTTIPCNFFPGYKNKE